jgi:hypothetical protein
MERSQLAAILERIREERTVLLGLHEKIIRSDRRLIGFVTYLEEKLEELDYERDKTEMGSVS